ncbi:hypothetical protein FOL47_003067 [Perkinsus chesapeaki]|uniref:Uncharacterized protein n=1 Tax=Perkinsus chesapeaki TaxID=330153 RepID=A0A7J6M9T8_PERCH|nr:hypothetical protein FOL47_003067 [Perkinsus chesapeaki]
MIIFDAAKDIEELDIGELDEPDSMQTDVSYSFREELDHLRASISHEGKATEDAFLMGANNGRSQMAFVTLKLDWTLENLKVGTDKLAADWKTRLTLGGLAKVNLYSFDPGRLLMTANDLQEISEMKKFILDQPETDL